MAYHFKLETLLTYRRNLEEQAKQQLVAELMILDRNRKQLVELTSGRQATIEEFENKKETGMAAAAFMFFLDSIIYQDRRIKAQSAAIEERKKTLVKLRSALADRVKDRKIIEKARQKDYQKYLLDILKKEQNESDELAILRFGRNMHL